MSEQSCNSSEEIPLKNVLFRFSAARYEGSSSPSLSCGRLLGAHPGWAGRATFPTGSHSSTEQSARVSHLRGDSGEVLVEKDPFLPAGDGAALPRARRGGQRWWRWLRRVPEALSHRGFWWWGDAGALAVVTRALSFWACVLYFCSRVLPRLVL